MKILLASASPRRRELLRHLGLPFEAVDSRVRESIGNCTPAAAALRLAQEKAQAITPSGREGIVIGADTLIDFEGQILGKPLSAGEAETILRRLCGRTHQVVTGLCVLSSASGRTEARTVATRVRMVQCSEQQIARYVASGEPMDKAGAYAIQGRGGKLVHSIEGCYFNVIGFPLCELIRMLALFEVFPKANGPFCRTPSGEPCPRLKAWEAERLSR